MFAADGVSPPGMVDLLGPEHLAGHYERFAREAIEWFNAHGAIAPQAIFVTLDQADPAQIVHASAMPPESVALALGSPEGREWFVQGVATLVGAASTSSQAGHHGSPDTPPADAAGHAGANATVPQTEEGDSEGDRDGLEALQHAVHMVVQVAEVSCRHLHIPAIVPISDTRNVMVALHTALGSFLGFNPIETTREGRRCVFRKLDLDASPALGPTSIRPQLTTRLH